MTLSELIERLQEIQEELGEDKDPEVMMAQQPSYPLAATIKGAVAQEELDNEEDDLHHAGEDIVWLAEGSQENYAPKIVFDFTE